MQNLNLWVWIPSGTAVKVQLLTQLQLYLRVVEEVSEPWGNKHLQAKGQLCLACIILCHTLVGACSKTTLHTLKNLLIQYNEKKKNVYSTAAASTNFNFVTHGRVFYIKYRCLLAIMRLM